MEVTANTLDRGFYMYQEEFEQKALEVLRSGWYVLGREVGAFESEFAAYIGCRHCVGLASGLDALWIAFRILGIGTGDEVLVQGNTYIASVMNTIIWIRHIWRKRLPPGQRPFWWSISTGRLPIWKKS